jgi:3-keto-disaccharide hydrolase
MTLRRTIRRLSVTAGLIVLVPAAMARAAATAPNQLTPAEIKAGWRLLFDGKTTSGWRGFKKTDFPADRWVVRDGALAHIPSGAGDSHGSGDIVTAGRFSDFDLRFDWRIAPGGNSGLKYFVTEDREGPIAHEYQVLDDARHPDAKIGAHRQTAAFYDVLPPAADKPLRPVGEWNESRVLVRGNHVEHWLNGSRVLQYELGSPELKAAIARSKFKDVPGFGTKIDGQILLQDHGDEVAFRNLKILSPPR